MPSMLAVSRSSPEDLEDVRIQERFAPVVEADLEDVVLHQIDHALGALHRHVSPAALELVGAGRTEGALEIAAAERVQVQDPGQGLDLDRTVELVALRLDEVLHLRGRDDAVAVLAAKIGLDRLRPQEGHVRKFERNLLPDRCSRGRHACSPARTGYRSSSCPQKFGADAGTALADSPSLRGAGGGHHPALSCRGAG
jgi:hypothetical protein